MRNRPSTVTYGQSANPTSSSASSNRRSYHGSNSGNDLLTSLGPPNDDYSQPRGSGADPSAAPPSYNDALRSPVASGDQQRARQQAQDAYNTQVRDAQGFQEQQAQQARQREVEEAERRRREAQQAQQQPQPPAPGLGTHVRRNSVEDPLAPLRRHHVLFLVDDSPSMGEGDLWQQVTQALTDILASAVKYDRDLPDIHFFNSEDRSIFACRGPEVLADVMRNIPLHGSTPTGYRIDDLLRPYVEKVEDSRGRGVGGTLNNAAPGERVKPHLLVVLTDGKADDPDMVRDVIVEFAQRLTECRAPPTQLGIQFIQIGSDPEATEFLQTLDDDLKAEHGIRDMIDTTPYQGRLDSAFLAKALLGAINRRLDSTGPSADRNSRRIVSA